MQVTSAYANKLLKKLQEEKEFLLNKESKNSTYIAAINEEPVIPEFDFNLNTKEINIIDEKIVKIKHALNIANITNTITANDQTMTIDMALVELAQLNARKKAFDILRKTQDKCRVNSVYSNKNMPEYTYANFNPADAQAEFEKVSNMISAIQLELDKYNQTKLFEIDD